MFIVLKTSRFLFKEGVGLQWIVPGLNSLSQREVEALRVSEVPLGQGLCGDTRESALELVEEVPGLGGTASSAQRTGQPWCHRTQWLTHQDPGDVTHSQLRGSETD